MGKKHKKKHKKHKQQELDFAASSNRSSRSIYSHQCEQCGKKTGGSRFCTLICYNSYLKSPKKKEVPNSQNQNTPEAATRCATTSFGRGGTQSIVSGSKNDDEVLVERVATEEEAEWLSILQKKLDLGEMKLDEYNLCVDELKKKGTGFTSSRGQGSSANRVVIERIPESHFSSNPVVRVSKSPFNGVRFQSGRGKLNFGEHCKIIEQGSIRNGLYHPQLTEMEREILRQSVAKVKIPKIATQKFIEEIWPLPKMDLLYKLQP